jgi:hypothetical protein
MVVRPREGRPLIEKLCEPLEALLADRAESYLAGKSSGPKVAQRARSCGVSEALFGRAEALQLSSQLSLRKPPVRK